MLMKHPKLRLLLIVRRLLYNEMSVYLYIGPGNIPDLLDLGAPLADERPALAGRHDEAQSDGRPRVTGAPAGSTTEFAELRTPLETQREISHTSRVQNINLNNTVMNPKIVEHGIENCTSAVLGQQLRPG